MPVVVAHNVRPLSHASAPGSSWGVLPGAADKGFFVCLAIRTPHVSKSLHGLRGRKHRLPYTPEMPPSLSARDWTRRSGQR